MKIKNPVLSEQLTQPTELHKLLFVLSRMQQLF